MCSQAYLKSGICAAVRPRRINARPLVPPRRSAVANVRYVHKASSGRRNDRNSANLDALSSRAREKACRDPAPIWSVFRMRSISSSYGPSTTARAWSSVIRFSSAFSISMFPGNLSAGVKHPIPATTKKRNAIRMTPHAACPAVPEQGRSGRATLPKKHEARDTLAKSMALVRIGPIATSIHEEQSIGLFCCSSPPETAGFPG